MRNDRSCTVGRRASRARRPCQWSPHDDYWLRMRWSRFKLDLFHSRRRGYYPVTLTTYRGSDVVRVSNYVPPELNVMKKKVLETAPEGQFKHLAPMESKVLMSFDQIIAHCAVVRYDDGDARKPGWIVLKTLGSAWMLEAKDPDTCCRMTASAGTLDDALTLMDLLLGSEQAPWEPDQWLRQAQAKKK